MNKLILTIGFLMAAAQNAYALECVSVAGKTTFATYWGHGQGWVNFPADSGTSSFTGPFTFTADKFTIASSTPDANLDLLRPDANSVWVGVLTVAGVKEYLICK